MATFLQALQWAYKGVTGAFKLEAAVSEAYIQTAADKQLAAFFEANHPDFVKLTSGEVTSLTAHAVLYEYLLLDPDGDVMLDFETHDPIRVRGVIFRYVGAGTSASSATYLKIVEDPDFFASSIVNEDASDIVGQKAYGIKTALAELRWDHTNGFGEPVVITDVEDVVKSAKEQISLHTKLSSLPSLDGRLSAVKQAQLGYESAMAGSLALAEKVAFEELLTSKNTILSQLSDAVRDYENFRREVKKQQSKQMMDFFLSAASIIASAAATAAAKVDKEQMQENWKSLNEKLEAVNSKAESLGAAVNSIASQLKAWDKPIPPVYEINISILVPTSHEGVTPPVPMGGPK